MHFDWYLDSPFLLNAYGRYFWYLEMNRATHVFAAYADGRFAGVLLAEIYGVPKQRQVWWQKLYVRFVDFIQKKFFKGGADLYEDTTGMLLENYRQTHAPDGEIIFLAADPDCGVKGIGAALLNAFEQQAHGKTIFLHTDDACTYQFYERRGFERAAQRQITLKMPKGNVPLNCFLYTKTIS